MLSYVIGTINFVQLASFHTLLPKGPSINYVVSVGGWGVEGGSPKDDLVNIH